MYNYLKNNILEQTSEQLGKEAYIANMLVRTLYSNDISDSEAYNIIKQFKNMVLGGDVTI